MKKKKTVKKKRNKKNVQTPRNVIKKANNSMINISNIFDKSSMLEKAPLGFRTVSSTAAIMEYGKPILELGAEVSDDMNVGLQMTMKIWNYSLQEEKSNFSGKQEVVKSLINTFKLDREKAEQFLEKMHERRLYLIPPEIQPEFKMNVFMRIEKDFVIEQFDYNKLNLNQEAEVTIPENDSLKDFGKITQISPMANYEEKPVTFDARLTFIPASAKDYFPGMTVELSILIEKKDNIYYLPIQAIFWSKVFVKGNKNSEWRNVATGISDNNFVEIISGLEKEEEVFLNAKDKFREIRGYR